MQKDRIGTWEVSGLTASVASAVVAFAGLTTTAIRTALGTAGDRQALPKKALRRTSSEPDLGKGTNP